MAAANHGSYQRGERNGGEYLAAGQSGGANERQQPIIENNEMAAVAMKWRIGGVSSVASAGSQSANQSESGCMQWQSMSISMNNGGES